MHFCPKCGNMYYLTLFDQDQDKLIYYCRNCGNKDKTLVDNLNNFDMSLLFFMVLIIVIYTHRENISRLRDKTENKVNF